MARNYKRLGGIINASAGPAKARAVFAESFGILRKKVVNLRKNPVSSRGLIQVGVNVTVPGKKKPLCQSTGLAAGARPVYKMYARPSCAKHKIKIPFLLLTTNSITLQNKKICHACAGFRSYCRQSTNFSLNFLFVSLAFDSAPFPPARNASFSRKFSF